MIRKQARTHRVSIHTIVASKEFARGFDEARKGLPFNPDNDEWDYERGRHFAFIAPINMPLRIGSKLNPKALKLAEAAYEKGKEDQDAGTQTHSTGLPPSCAPRWAARRRTSSRLASC
jgi:hypothetical protein